MLNRMKPREEILDQFYNLAEYDDTKRHHAVLAVVEAFRTDGDYCMERLVVGLASTRAAARLGFSCALTVILSSAPEEWSSDRLFQLIDKKLEMKKADGVPPVIGQHLAYTAMINSNVASELVSRELILFEKNRCFGMAICDSIARIALQLKENKFAKHVWPLVEKFVTEPLKTLLPEWIYFVLLVLPKFSQTIQKKVNFINGTDGLSLQKINREDLLSVLKKTRGDNGFVLGIKLLSVARKSGNFEIMFESFIEPWLLLGDLQKAFERTLTFIDRLVATEELSASELLKVFSPKFIQILLTMKGNKESRYATPLAENILRHLIKSLDEDKWSMKHLLTLLDRINSDVGNLDDLFHPSFNITEKALSKLDAKGVEKFVAQAICYSSWPHKSVVKVFNQWSEPVQEKMLVMVLQQEPRTKRIQQVFCECISSLFTTNVRAGKSVRSSFSDSSVELLQNVLKSFLQDDDSLKLNDRALLLLYLSLRLWSLSSFEEHEATSYLRDADEVVALDKKLASSGSENVLSILIDLLLSILSRSQRFHRSVIHFVFATLVSKFNLKNIMHIFETIDLPDYELMKSKEEDSETDEDDMSMEQNNVVKETEENAEEVEEEEEESSEESYGSEDLRGEVDPDFVEELQTVLDTTKADNNNALSDTESISSNVSDETMFKLDESLAAVFTQRKKSSHRVDQVAVGQSLQFRLKCFDLLLIVASHADSKNLAVDMLLPLLEIAHKFVRRKDGMELFNKSRNLLEIIIKYKKGVINESKALKLFDEMISISSKIVNPLLKNEVGKIATFLFSVGCKSESKRKSDKMVRKLDDLLATYMTKDNNQILNEAVISPFMTYPNKLIGSLEKLIAFGFDEGIRIFKRTEALSCAIAFMRKDLVCENSKEATKFWKHFTKLLSSCMHNYLSKITAEELRPRFFAFAIRLSTMFASLTTSINKQEFSEAIDTDLNLFSKRFDDWKLNAKKKQQLNSMFQRVCGRSSVAAVKHLHSLLKKVESS